MQDQIATELEMLQKCLTCKKQILDKIYEQTREQEAILDTEPFSEEAFDVTLTAKGEQIELLNKYDQGFEQIFQKNHDVMMANKERYRTILMMMQQQIAEVTELGIKIQKLEQQNKIKMDIYLNTKKKQIRNFNVSNRTVTNYYSAMNKPQNPDSFFMDKKS